jgi:hypothetical protein
MNANINNSSQLEQPPHLSSKPNESMPTPELSIDKSKTEPKIIPDESNKVVEMNVINETAAPIESTQENKEHKIITNKTTETAKSGAQLVKELFDNSKNNWSQVNKDLFAIISKS